MGGVPAKVAGSWRKESGNRRAGRAAELPPAGARRRDAEPESRGWFAKNRRGEEINDEASRPRCRLTMTNPVDQTGFGGVPSPYGVAVALTAPQPGWMKINLPQKIAA